MTSKPAYVTIAEEIKSTWLSDNNAAEGRKLPTQEDLASRFHVSRSTVIRALSKLIAEGYLHSQQGSGVYITERLPRTAPRSIGLIVPDLHAHVIVQACRGVERRARQAGFQVLLASSEGHLKHEQELVEQHLQAGARGVLLYPVTRCREQLSADYLANPQSGVPIIAIDIECETWPCTRVLFDNYRLGYDMTQLLHRHGHRHIAFMHIDADYLHSSIHDRRLGWEAAMADAGLPIPPEYYDWPYSSHSFQSAARPMAEVDYEATARGVLRLSPRPDAVITWNDIAAAQLTQALQHLGVSVPDDIRITGFDNEPLLTRLFRPLFPTSRPDFTRLGELAVDALIGELKNRRATPRTYYYSVPVLWRDPRTAPHRDVVGVDTQEVVAHTIGVFTPS